MSRKRGREDSPPTESIFHSSSIEDRNSTFIGAYSPALSATKLQSLPEFKTASHRIVAWRFPSAQKSLSQKTLYTTGHDDDGEQYAGKKIERVLADVDVVGAVIVARWYGGVLLGPVRFSHIEDCARGAIAAWRGEEERVRRVKTEGQQCEKLRKMLEERDNSIAVLRELLAEKTGKPSSPLKAKTAVSYADLELDALQRLEKARDGSIKWILKAIDQAEEAAEAGRTTTGADDGKS